MRRNTTGQYVAAQLVSKVDGSAVTSGTTTLYFTGDNGTQTAGTGTLVHKGNGVWSYAVPQGETNYEHIAFCFTNSSAVPRTVNVYPFDAIAPLVRANLLGLFQSICRSNVGADADIGGTFAPSTDSLEAIRDTAPMGTAMRGTDNALLASGYTAPNNAGIATIAGQTASISSLASQASVNAAQTSINTMSGNVDAIKVISDRYGTMIEFYSSTYWRYINTSLELAPIGAATYDWTDDERKQIRSALGVDGTKVTAAGGQLQSLTSSVTTMGSNVTAIKAKTDNLPADPASNTTVATRLATVSYTAPDNAGIAAIKAKTDNLPASPAAVGSQMDLVAAPNATAVTAIQNGLATQALLTTVGNNVSTVYGSVLLVKAKTDLIPASPAAVGSQMDLVAAPNGAAITAIQSGLATASSLSTVGGNVTAVKAKTDLIPASPAAVGSQMDLVAAPNSAAVAAIQASLASQTTVAAVKAKTDLIPASPAAVGSAMTLTADYDRAKTALALSEYTAPNNAGVGIAAAQATIAASMATISAASATASADVKTILADMAALSDGHYVFYERALVNAPTVTIEEIEASLLPVLDEISSHTGLISSGGQVTVTSPVSLDGSEIEFVRYDDYTSAAGQMIEFEDGSVTWPDWVTDPTSSVYLTVRRKLDDSLVFSKIGTVITSGTYTLVKFEPTGHDLALLPIGRDVAKFDVLAAKNDTAGTRKTIAIGIVHGVENQNRP